jgi:hypothetical protein
MSGDEGEIDGCMLIYPCETVKREMTLDILPAWHPSYGRLTVLAFHLHE